MQTSCKIHFTSRKVAQSTSRGGHVKSEKKWSPKISVYMRNGDVRYSQILNSLAISTALDKTISCSRISPQRSQLSLKTKKWWKKSQSRSRSLSPSISPPPPHQLHLDSSLSQPWMWNILPRTWKCYKARLNSTQLIPPIQCENKCDITLLFINMKRPRLPGADLCSTSNFEHACLVQRSTHAQERMYMQCYDDRWPLSTYSTVLTVWSAKSVTTTLFPSSFK